MNCPFCAGEMEEGYVMSGQNLLWSPYAPAKVPLRFWKKEGEFALDINPFGGAKLKGFRCAACRKIIVDYQAPPEETQKESKK